MNFENSIPASIWMSNHPLPFSSPINPLSRKREKKNVDGKLNSPVQVNLGKEEMALGRVACGTDLYGLLYVQIHMLLLNI